MTYEDDIEDAEEESRAAFEALVMSPPYEFIADRHSEDPKMSALPGGYRSPCVQLAWRVWCERGKEVLELQQRLENEYARSVHSCTPQCTRDGCVNRKLREEMTNMGHRLEAIQSELNLWKSGL
jgi:hypothetical protein